eukprot:SAG11_NODE_15998_length_560_cov_0.422993_1_plen_109_part_10
MNTVIISDDVVGGHWRLGGPIPVGVPGCRVVGNLTTRECGDEMQVAEVMWPAEGVLVAVIRTPGHPAMTSSRDGGKSDCSRKLRHNRVLTQARVSIDMYVALFGFAEG